MKQLSYLECEVLNLLNSIYKCEFNHNIKVDFVEGGEDTPNEYILRLYLHDNRWAPLTIATQCKTDEEFLCFVKKQLQKKNLIRSEHYKIKLDGNN